MPMTSSEPRKQPGGMGCMRLSTEQDRDETRAIELLHTAFEGGVTFLDTANAYCLNDDDIGHNERLISRALASWSGDRSRIVVATKGGLTRPNGEWVPNGKARHLRTACEASLRALGVQRIRLYQLHAPDPRTPLSTSVRALNALRNEGLVDRVGLCNVNVSQIEEARRITDISAVQIELSLWHDTSLLNGVVLHCIEHGIQLIAYRPLCGSRRSRRLLSDPVLAEIASRHDATPGDIALAWLYGLSDVIVSIPGPTRLETLRSVIRAHDIQLTDEDRARLNATLPSGRAISATVRGASNRPVATVRDGEVVLVMGLPGRRQEHRRPRLRHPGVRAAKSRRGRRIVTRSVNRSPRARVIRWYASGARQHLCLARIACARGAGGHQTWHARALRLALDEHRGRTGQRGVAHGVEVRSPARARRDAQDRQARRPCLRTRSAVPRSARARASGFFRRLLANRHDAVRAKARFVDDKQGTDRVVRRRADSQPLRRTRSSGGRRRRRPRGPRRRCFAAITTRDGHCLGWRGVLRSRTRR